MQHIDCDARILGVGSAPVSPGQVDQQQVAVRPIPLSLPIRCSTVTPG